MNCSERKVEGTDFVRDTRTNSLINKNRSEYDEFVRKKRKKLQEKKRIEELEKKVNNLDDKISEILSIIQKKENS